MKGKKLFISIVSIFAIISFIIGVSYAYFTTQVVGNDTASTQNIKTGTLRINYTGTDTLDMNNTEPPDTKSMTFTVTNSGTLPVNNYQVYFSKVLNEILNDEMVYTLTCQSSDTNTCLGKEETPLPKVVGSALTQPSIAPGTTHTYTLSVTFKDTGSNQDYNQGKSLMFKITINEQFDIPTIIAAPFDQGWWTTTGYFWEYKDDITSITFEDGIDIPVGAIETWDVSEANDGSIVAYIIDDGLGTSTYDLFIQTNNGLIMANPNSAYLFYNFTNLTTINNISMLRTYYVTNMSSMFYRCSSLTSIDLSSFDTSEVTDMYNMFGYCSSLTNLNLSSFDTSSVTNMSQMFWRCSSLTSLDVSTFDTSSVTDMSSMFSNSISLTSLDLSTFDTGSVTNMSYMFAYCDALISIDLSTFDTSSVTSIRGIFYNCSALTSLDLSSFDTSSVTNMFQMFYNCSSLTSLDLSTFDTSSVTTMYGMFHGCSSLTSLDLSTFDTSSVTDMSWMFWGCSSLTSLDLSTFDTSSVTDMSDMFFGCGSLTSLDLSTFDTSNVTTMHWMFTGCSSLTSLDFRLADFSSVSYSMMFTSITSGINIVVKDTDAQTFINARLTDAGKTGNVTIYVP